MTLLSMSKDEIDANDTNQFQPASRSLPYAEQSVAIDLAGPMPPAPAKKDMMIVTIDYFTKWIEAKALSSTKEANMEWFI